MTEIFVCLIAVLLSLVTVAMHYETMALVSDKLIPWVTMRLRRRRVIAVTVATLLGSHLLQIAIFAFAAGALAHFPELGRLESVEGGEDWFDYLYVSTVSYATLGDGSVRLAGPLRAIGAIEAVVGMMMLTWSASFTYLKMEKLWRAPNLD